MSWGPDPVASSQKPHPRFVTLVGGKLSLLDSLGTDRSLSMSRAHEAAHFRTPGARESVCQGSILPPRVAQKPGPDQGGIFEGVWGLGGLAREEWGAWAEKPTRNYRSPSSPQKVTRGQKPRPEPREPQSRPRHGSRAWPRAASLGKVAWAVARLLVAFGDSLWISADFGGARVGSGGSGEPRGSAPRTWRL